jgi:3-deoxy-D-manno-octulosonate 8-phosphate phosphatase KdsC-like HAD superfamily phosphatase
MTKKMTKREMYEQIKANYALTEEEVAFIDHELELLAKKNASTGERKPTATQKANEGVKDAIVDVLVANGEQMTVSEIVKVIDGDYTNQKISALLRQLIADGKVEKVVDKRKSFFKVA